MLRANTSFMVGDRRIIHSGDLVDPGDPVIRGRESLFSPVDGAPTNKPPAKRAAKPAKAPAKKAAAKPAEVGETGPELVAAPSDGTEPGA